MIMWALALACALMDGLINKLGDDSYVVREKAARQIKILDVAALPALQYAYANASDPEIKYRAKVLIQEFMYPDVPDGMWAESIWNLPNDYRYTEEDNFSIDHAVDCYAQAWEAQLAAHRHDFGWANRSMHYNDGECEYEAVVLFVAEARLKGMTYKEYHKLYERMIDNRKFGWHVDSKETWGYYTVPSPILTKQVIEGVQ
jgi:hypothetical protein